MVSLPFYEPFLPVCALSSLSSSQGLQQKNLRDLLPMTARWLVLHQIQYVLGIATLGLLFAHHQPPNLCRIADSQGRMCFLWGFGRWVREDGM